AANALVDQGYLLPLDAQNLLIANARHLARPDLLALGSRP
ncbi:MAG: hypothetical protein QOI13_606, partial [Paraburkholderia sp.]|nr:hypothetical protein [Paraburkholderia sp.]